MTTKLISLLNFAPSIILLATSSAIAADKPDFSGSYVLTGAKGSLDSKKAGLWTLQVAQSASTIEVRRSANSKEYINVYPLDGTKGVCETSGGVKGICGGRFNGKVLTLDQSVITRPVASGTSVEMHQGNVGNCHRI